MRRCAGAGRRCAAGAAAVIARSAPRTREPHRTCAPVNLVHLKPVPGINPSWSHFRHVFRTAPRRVAPRSSAVARFAQRPSRRRSAPTAACPSLCRRLSWPADGERSAWPVAPRRLPPPAPAAPRWHPRHPRPTAPSAPRHLGTLRCGMCRPVLAHDVVAVALGTLGQRGDQLRAPTCRHTSAESAAARSSPCRRSCARHSTLRGNAPPARASGTASRSRR